MQLPISFDHNEWFVLISFVINFVLVFLLPRRFPRSVVILIFLFSAVVARLCDHLLAGPSFDFYNLMDTGKYESKLCARFFVQSLFLYSFFVCFFVVFFSVFFSIFFLYKHFFNGFCVHTFIRCVFV